MAKKRGLRSSNDAKPWKCRCGKVNHPTKHRFFDVPAFECRGCKREFQGNFKFCLGEIEAEGGSLIGEVWDQSDMPYCVAYAYGKAVEISERVFNVNNGKNPDEVECIDPCKLQHKFEDKFPGVASKDDVTKDHGIHKVLHMGLMLKEEGILKETSNDKYKIEDLSTIPRDDFETITRCLAEGIPMMGTYLAGKRRGKLRYCQIYKSPPLSRYMEKRAKRKGHAVVLIGAGMKNGRRFFYFLNSWNKKFCPRKNTHGEIIMGGIGKIQEGDLTKNVIKISCPDKTDSRRRLEAQHEFNISNYNYLLMMGLKDHFASIMLHRAKQSKFQRDDEEPQWDYSSVEKLREEHLVYGPFCDDEAKYPQDVGDRYEELVASFTEMEWRLVDHDKLHRNEATSHPRTIYGDNKSFNRLLELEASFLETEKRTMEEDLLDKLHHDQAAKTDDTIHLVHGVAQPATSGALAAASHRASVTPSSGPAGGLGDLLPCFGATGTTSGRPLDQHQLTQSPNLLRAMMSMPMVQNLMNDPDLIRNMNTNTPEMRGIIDRIPDIAHVLKDSIVLCQTIEAARDPEILTEMMQNTDRSMSNIKSSPKGFTMLWDMYETVQEPFLSATTMGGEGNTASKPFAALHGNKGSNQPSNPATIAPTTASESTTGIPANSRTGAAGGLGGLNSADLRSMRGGSPDASLLPNPSMVQNIMSDPQSKNQLLKINPNACNLMESNTQLREMFKYPEFLRQFTPPETLQHLLSFQRTLSSQLGQHQPSQDGNQSGNGTGTLSGLGAGGGIAVPNASTGL